MGNSQTKGVEWDLTYAGYGKPTTLSFAGSYNDATLQEDFWRSDDDRIAGEPPTAPDGTAMPYVPEWQLSAIGRFDFNVGGLPAFGQAAVSYTDSAWNNLDVAIRQEMDAYTLVNLTTGIEKEDWTLTFYVNNLFDERGQVDILDPGYFSPSGIDYNENIIRPRAFGVRWAQRFR